MRKKVVREKAQKKRKHKQVLEFLKFTTKVNVSSFEKKKEKICGDWVRLRSCDRFWIMCIKNGSDDKTSSKY